MTTTRAKVAFSKDFLTAYSDLPKKAQKKVREFTEKFQQDPTQTGINFERLDGARDEKVRSVRIGIDYRAIVIHPPKGDVYLCVWVDHHDEAYRWVKNKRFDVNPTSGVFQVFGMADEATAPTDAPTPTAPTESPEAHLLSALDEEDLILAGVPIPLLPAVRALHTEADLEALLPHLPEDTAEVLFALASGFSLTEALTEVDRKPEKESDVDTQDFATALARAGSQRGFKVVDDHDDLQAMLDRPLAQWRIFLHPTQSRLVAQNANGPVRVLGGAGTGKTVVLMHRARHLVKSVFSAPGDRLLVTTFTRNLAIDLKQNLRYLCGQEFDRLEVVHLHSWAAQFLRRQGLEVKIADDKTRQRLMNSAIDELGERGLPRAFFREEWDQVVQPQEVLDRDSYFRARRVGRGTRLGRRQRADVWQVLSCYRELLQEAALLEWPDAVREARLLLAESGITPPFRAVCADEVQDFSATELRLLRALAAPGPNDMFLVGDGHQRIYGQPIAMSRCGIEVRGRSRRLKLNYRTTDRIAKHSLAILRDCEIDDLDGGIDTLKGYTSLRHGDDPEIHIFDHEAAEARFIVDRIKKWLDAGADSHEICVAARTGKLVKQRYQAMLEAAGIPTFLIEQEPESATEPPGVRLATMHRMKGLEFPRVLLESVQDGTVPLMRMSGALTDQQTLQERCLFYVACTRARDELVITGYGEPSELPRRPSPHRPFGDGAKT